ncbi:MAG: purine-binding chemotaxis protein CheW [Candidatus Petromonas sp.]|jgi:purine-binding chemotaxis protein CheW|nr:purine-binding chemotaxis protein CheW [Candidatus Petromonas sp.]
MASQEYVLFKLEDEYYGIDINNVETIEKIMPITRVPYTQDFVKGVINLRGNVVPVIDLRKRLNLEEKPYDDNSRIIIVQIDDITVGMIVDSSSEVIQLNHDEIDESPSINIDNDDYFIECIGKKDNRIIIIINLHKVLNINNLLND